MTWAFGFTVMADIKSKESRSANMAKIKSKDTSPEVWFRKALFSLGYRYRTNSNNITGHPDIYLARYKTAIFVNGCFWHRHAGCKYSYTPKSRIEFWTRKFENNVKRDQKVHGILQEEGIKVLVVWECTIKQMQRSQLEKNVILQEVEDFLRSEEMRLEL